MSTPQPSTATVSPPAASAPLCAAVSMPRAMPLDDRQSGVGQVRREPLRHRNSVRRRTARADHAQRQRLQQFDASPREQHDRRIEDLAQRAAGIADRRW